MKKLNMARATDRYNGIMFDVGADHLTVGIPGYSEDTDGWNLRDMIAEADYVLSTYYENGHVNNDLRFSEEEEERKAWRSDTGKLKRFIQAYEPFAVDLVCKDSHCSKYDNPADIAFRNKMLAKALARR